MSGASAVVTIVVSLIAAIPPTIIALAVWRSTVRNRRNLENHIGDEGITSEAIMRALETISEAVGVSGTGRHENSGR